ncbi:unnamed protein product [Schistosoma rodhaini]|uniref:Uncharacterized protein n=1 Tax=Schistosoma rodhaini TaxID=6188 RepID=A0AA85FDN9_9TREM|nr:unnamed protein product [Schistosoma rodhaini]
MEIQKRRRRNEETTKNPEDRGEQRAVPRNHDDVTFVEKYESPQPGVLAGGTDVASYQEKPIRPVSPS